MISIHATPTGRDIALSASCVALAFQFTRPLRAAIESTRAIVSRILFQFTRPLRAAMSRIFEIWQTADISIHATPTGRDLCYFLPKLICFISIHATPTGRDDQQCLNIILFTFQFTRPLRAAIKSRGKVEALKEISIHATPTGRDTYHSRSRRSRADFNSRDPYGPRST